MGGRGPGAAGSLKISSRLGMMSPCRIAAENHYQEDLLCFLHAHCHENQLRSLKVFVMDWQADDATSHRGDPKDCL